MNDESLVYYAEGVIYARFLPVTFSGIPDAREYVAYMQGDKWFRERWPTVAKVDMAVRLSRNYKWSTAQVWNNTIYLSKYHMNEFVVCHEMAHMCTKKELAKELHGPKFCGTYIAMIRHFVGREEAKSLKQAFDACGVEYENV